jgi:mitogen-activated protein kinase kinase 4
MNSSGKLQIDGKTYDFTSDDLQDIGEIGRGGFGTVNKMVHRKSNTVVAVKRIRSTVDEKEQKQLLMDLDVVMKSNECRYIVQFYGALFKEVSFKSAKSSSWFRVTTNMCLTYF